MLFKYRLDSCKSVFYDSLNYIVYFRQEDSIILIPVVNKVYKLNRLFTGLNKRKLKNSLKYTIDSNRLVILRSNGIFYMHQTKHKLTPLNILDIFQDNTNFKTIRDKFIIQKNGEFIVFVKNEMLNEKYQQPEFKSWFLIRICYFLAPNITVLWEFDNNFRKYKSGFKLISEPILVDLSEIQSTQPNIETFSVVFRLKILRNNQQYDQLHEIKYSRNAEFDFVSKNIRDKQDLQPESLSTEENDSFDSNRFLILNLRFELDELRLQRKHSIPSKIILSKYHQTKSHIKSFLCLENTSEHLLYMIRQTESFKTKSMNICLIHKGTQKSNLLLEADYDFDIKSDQNKYVNSQYQIEYKDKHFFFIIFGDIFCVIEKRTNGKSLSVQSQFHINFECFYTCQHIETNDKFYFILDSRLYIWDLATSTVVFKIEIRKFYDQKYQKFLFKKDQMTLTCFPELSKYRSQEAHKKYLITICIKRFIVLNKNLMYVPNNLGFERLTYDYSDLIDTYNCFHMEEDVFLRYHDQVFSVSENILDLDQSNSIIPPLMFLKQYVSKLFRNQDAFIDEIESYCQFVFMHVKEANYVDFTFKSLNPLILLIYYNKPYILKSMLVKFGFCFIPTYSYYGLFEFCLRLQRKECLQEIRSYVLDHSPNEFRMNYHDYDALLRSADKQNHLLLSLLFQSEKNSITPNFIYMHTPVQVKEYPDISVLSSEEATNLSKNKRITNTNVNRFSSYQFESKSLNRAGSFVQSVTLPFNLNLSVGSFESVNLSKYFSSSSCDDFVESDFKHLIEQKWKNLRLFHYLHTLNYSLFILFFILSNVFYKELLSLRVISSVLIILILLLELLEFVSSFRYDRTL